MEPCLSHENLVVHESGYEATDLKGYKFCGACGSPCIINSESVISPQLLDEHEQAPHYSVFNAEFCL